MLCEKCGKYPATTHIHTLINGVTYDKNLCEYCALNEGFEPSFQSSISSVLASMLSKEGQNQTRNEKRCSVCGLTFSMIGQNGKVGCAHCYKTFKSELLPYIKSVHGSTKHIGKTTENALNIDEISRLKAELNRMIDEENYEQAAVIRDKIREAELGRNG